MGDGRGRKASRTRRKKRTRTFVSKKRKRSPAKSAGARKGKTAKRKKHPSSLRKKRSVKHEPSSALSNQNTSAQAEPVAPLLPVQESTSQKPSVPEKGINLIGYVRTETGLGESCRLAAQSIETTGIPFGMLNFPLSFIRSEDLSWSHKEMENAKYNINVFHMNADMIGHAVNHFGPSLVEGKYNIGYWHWELPEFPEEFCSAFQFLHEVWTPSMFVADSISRKAKVPVVRIPHGIRVQFDPGMNRESFGLPEDKYLFLCMYDTQSYQPRKNPQGAIQAFKLAFAPDRSDVGLVIHMNNAGLKTGELQTLQEMTADYSSVYLISSQLTRMQVNSLLQCTDGYISLHRSEGFGLGLAEAMYLGKPVIATNWSGNTDFMHAKNSCPVNYELVRLGQDYGPYKADQMWADPDLQHAAQYMQLLVENPAWRASIASAGQATIREFYSPEVAGETIKQRLARLGLL